MNEQEEMKKFNEYIKRLGFVMNEEMTNGVKPKEFALGLAWISSKVIIGTSEEEHHSDNFKTFAKMFHDAYALNLKDYNENVKFKVDIEG